MSLWCFHYFWKGLLERKLQNFALDSCLKITTQSTMISRIGWYCMVWLVTGLRSSSLENSSLFPICEKIQGARAHQLRQHFPEILSSHHCTDRPGPATKNILAYFFREAKDISINPQLRNIYFEKVHYTEQPRAHAKRAEKVVLYLYRRSLYSGQNPSAK